MLIQCKIQRVGGTKVTLEKTDYHFKNDEKGRAVCKVTSKKHQALFLKVPEAYQELKDEPT